MNPSEDARQNVYKSILKTASKRLEQAVPGSSEGTFGHLSLAAVLNLLFLLRGEWGSIGDYVTLSDHFKSGQRLSLQNRPTEAAVQD